MQIATSEAEIVFDVRQRNKLHMEENDLKSEKVIIPEIDGHWYEHIASKVSHESAHLL